MPKPQAYPAFAQYTNQQLKEAIARCRPAQYSTNEIGILKKVLKGDPPDDLRRTQVTSESGILYLFQLMDEMSRRDPKWAEETLLNLKLTIPPLYTKRTSPGVYARNYLGLCTKLTLMWIQTHLTYTSAVEKTRSLKPEFYNATTSTLMPRTTGTLTSQYIDSQLYAWVKRLEASHIMPVGASLSEIFWDCRILEMQIAAICHTLCSDFVSLIELIVKTMAHQGFLSLAIYIISFDLNHAMGMIIRVRPDYISVVFYDSNAIGGDAKVALSRKDPTSWRARIKSLLSFSIATTTKPNTDFTLTCLNTNAYRSDKLDFPNRPHAFCISTPVSTHDSSKFLYNLVGSGGTGEVYLGEVRRLCAIEDIDINMISETGSTSLYSASYLGNSPVVQILVQNPRINVNVLLRGKNVTPLFIASGLGHTRVVEILLTHPNTNVNLCTNSGDSPLYIASRWGNIGVIRVLVQHPKINLNAANAKGETPLFIATLFEHVAAVEILSSQPNININVSLQDLPCPLYVACLKGNILIVKILLAHNADINLKFKDFSPLNTAIYHKHFEIAKLLLTREKIEVRTADIQDAMRHGETRLAKELEKRMAEALKKTQVSSRGITDNTRHDKR